MIPTRLFQHYCSQRVVAIHPTPAGIEIVCSSLQPVYVYGFKTTSVTDCILVNMLDNPTPAAHTSINKQTLLSVSEFVVLRDTLAINSHVKIHNNINGFWFMTNTCRDSFNLQFAFDSDLPRLYRSSESLMLQVDRAIVPFD